jgi:hypothetical protein
MWRDLLFLVLGVLLGGVISPPITLIGEHLRDWLYRRLYGPGLEANFDKMEGTATQLRVVIRNNGTRTSDIYRLDVCPPEFDILDYAHRRIIHQEDAESLETLRRIWRARNTQSYSFLCSPQSAMQSLSPATDDISVRPGESKVFLFDAPKGLLVVHDTGTLMAGTLFRLYLGHERRQPESIGAMRLGAVSFAKGEAQRGLSRPPQQPETLEQE